MMCKLTKYNFKWPLALLASFSLVCLQFLTTDAFAAPDRVALVIGNAKYAAISPDLVNSKSDAAKVASLLRTHGFTVVELYDGSHDAMRAAFATFAKYAGKSELALFYFSGHGIQLYGQNFLVPTDFNPESLNQRDDFGFDLAANLMAVQKAGTKRLVTIIDACRNDPFAPSVSSKIAEAAAKSIGGNGDAPSRNTLIPGLASIDATPKGTEAAAASIDQLFLFAAQPGQVASDGPRGNNSPFTRALLNALARTDIKLTDAFVEVARSVQEATKSRQRPELRISWASRDMYLSQARHRAANVKYDFDGGFNPAAASPEVQKKVNKFFEPQFLQGPFLLAAALPLKLDPAAADYKGRSKRSGFLPAAVGVRRVRGISLTVDLDGDGTPEEILIGDGNQEPVEFWIRKNGRSYEFFPDCIKYTPTGINSAEAASRHERAIVGIEIAVADVNDNRRPDIWMRVEREGESPWASVCIFEFDETKISLELHQGPNQVRVAPLIVTPLIAMNTVFARLLADGVIEACSFNCNAVRTVYQWSGEEFYEYDSSNQVIRKFVSEGWSEKFFKQWSK